MKFRFLFFLVILLTGACSNNLRFFTDDIQEEFNWSENELKQIQFYLSEDIVLHRRLNAEESRITDGKIRVIDGSDVEEIVFKRGTPGIVIFTPKENRFAVSFEDDDNRFLMFGPNPKAGGRYVLLAQEWDKRLGKVSYNDKIYTTSSAHAFSALMVDIKKARNLSVRSRTAGGRTVSG